MMFQIKRSSLPDQDTPTITYQSIATPNRHFCQFVIDYLSMVLYFDCWYPFLLDWNYCILDGFDYWRIDTRELGAEWFLDNVMYRDSVMGPFYNSLYVYTKN